MRTTVSAMLGVVIAMSVIAAPAHSREGSSKFKRAGLTKYERKDYGGAIGYFDKHLDQSPTDWDIVLLRGLAKSLLKPEDVAGACADFLVVKNALKDMNVEGYCAGQPGWGSDDTAAGA